jgi:LysR family tcuABC transcriptional regulator
VEELYFASIGFKADQLSLAQLVEYPLVAPSTGHSIRTVIDTALQEHGMTITPIAEIDSMAILKQVAATSLASTILSGAALSEYGSVNPQLSFTRFAPELLMPPLSLCQSELMASSAGIEATSRVLSDAIVDLVNKGVWLGATLVGPSGVRNYPIAFPAPRF